MAPAAQTSSVGVDPCGGGGSRLVRTLVIDNYDSYTYNLAQLIAEVSGVEPTVLRNDEIGWAALAARLEAGEWDNVVISPGPGTPHNKSDIGVAMDVLKHAATVPILGVCLGHQALATAHGGSVVHAPEPVHGRLSGVAHTGEGVFAGVPQGAEVVRYHSLTVEAASLPACLRPVAWTVDRHGGTGLKRLRSLNDPAALAELLRKDSSRGVQREAAAACEDSDGLIMGLAHRSRPHYGIQFHPESIATQFGIAMLVNFREITAARLGLPPQPGVANGAGPPGHPTPARPWSGCAGEPNLRLEWRKADGLLAEAGGSEALFWALFGRDAVAGDTFWLDSATAPERGRFSYMGGRGGSLWRRLLYRLPRTADSPDTDNGSQVAGTLEVEDASGGVHRLATSLLDYLDAQFGANRLAVSAQDAEALPFDFWGGYVGYLGYEMKAECSGRLAHDSPTPDAGLLLADRFVAVDHCTQDVYVLAMRPAGGDDGGAAAWVDATMETIRGLPKSTPRGDAGARSPGVNGHALSGTDQSQPAPFRLCHPRAEYIKNVAACQQALHDGESYEVCLTTALCRDRAPCPRALYRALRQLNPAPYAAWLAFGGGGPTICCSSPERFLRCGRGGLLEAKPIKGTAPRVLHDPKADAAAAVELESNEKDRAENLMIADLLRNDLGRVCEVGSVHVPSLMAIESFATVHQLVSTVRGLRKAGSSIVDCLRATYPGGSMTGAPKRRTMDILDRLEGRARGVYSGSLGYLGFNDTFDLNIVIRTAVLHPGGVYVGAGGAIVVQSTTEGEYDEMKLKARAPLAAFGAADGGGAPGGTAPPAQLEEHVAYSGPA